MKNIKLILYIFLVFVLSINLISCKTKNIQPLKTTKNIATTEENKPDTSKEIPKAQPLPKVIKEVQGLVAVKDIDNSIVQDLKYATTDNFTGKKIYPVDICLLQKETAIKLAKANEEFKKSGYKIKIWDAYRPVYVQKIFWDLVKDSRFVADPSKGGSRHNTGVAVDITLVDMNGKELKMPSKFDDFSVNAYRNNAKMEAAAKKNMDFLTSVMKQNGFVTIDTEWWHFEDSNFAKYKIIDVKFDEFLDKENSVTLSLAGDCTLGTDDKFDYSKSFPSVLKKNGGDFSYFFKNVASIFKNDDITTVNLETTLTNATDKLPKLYNFKGSPEYAKILKLGGIEAVNISNNHIFDFKQKGLDDTINSLSSGGVNYFGEKNVWTTEVKGHKFAFLGYSGVQEDDSFDENSIKTMKQDIEKFKSEDYTVIINIHWGNESQYTPNYLQKRVAHLAIDSGADLIVGHHPHVIEGIELYKGKYICYSLGNFCFGGNSNPPDYDTFIFQMQYIYSNNSLQYTSARVIPCSVSSVSNINDYCPTPLNGDKKGKLLSKLNKLSFNLSFTINDEFYYTNNN